MDAGFTCVVEQPPPQEQVNQGINPMLFIILGLAVFIAGIDCTRRI